MVERSNYIVGITVWGYCGLNSPHSTPSVKHKPSRQYSTSLVQIFIQIIHDHFKNLYQREDHVTVLLPYQFYCKATRNIWWIELRAQLECGYLITVAHHATGMKKPLME